MVALITLLNYYFQGGGSLKFNSSKIIFVAFTLILIALPTVSNASLSDLEWRVQVDDKLNYTYLGISDYESTVIVEEEIYFIIEDLTGVPLPSYGGPSVTAYWPNGSLFDESDESELGWYTDNLPLIDGIAVRVGNWSLYTELVEDYWASREINEYNVVIEETATVWNVTITVYFPGPLLFSQSAFSYTKSTGILIHSYYVRYAGGSEDDFDAYLSLTRLREQPAIEVAVVIGTVTIVGILVIMITLKKRK